MIRFFLLLFLLISFPASAANTVEHVVEKGETALQIALDHNLTIAQLQQLNPDADLDMMMIGDVLTLPADPVQTFGDFLTDYYGEKLEITSFDCGRLADGSALCLGEVTNRTDLPLTNVTWNAYVRDSMGVRGEADGAPSLIQIEPHETIPLVIPVYGAFGSLTESRLQITALDSDAEDRGSFRLSEDRFTFSVQPRPGGMSADLLVTFLSSFPGKKINLLASAYNSEGRLTAVRSFYGDYRNQLRMDLYAFGGGIDSVRLLIEVYQP